MNDTSEIDRIIETRGLYAGRIKDVDVAHEIALIDGGYESETEANEASVKLDELLTQAGEILERARESSTEALKTFTELELREDQAFACFELFYTQNYGMSYNEFYVEKDEADNSVFNIEYHPMTDARESFLPELNTFIEDSFSNARLLLSDKYGLQFAKRSEEQLFKWFSECWSAAGGKESRVPTYLALDKENQVRDLATGEVMSEKEAAIRRGFNIEA